MTIAELIAYLKHFDGDTLVFLTEEQAADELAGEEHPEYVALDHISFSAE